MSVNRFKLKDLEKGDIVIVWEPCGDNYKQTSTYTIRFVYPRKLIVAKPSNSPPADWFIRVVYKREIVEVKRGREIIVSGDRHFANS